MVGISSSLLANLLGINGSGYVTLAESENNDYLFTNVIEKISEIKWMDQDETLGFTQSGGILDAKFTVSHTAKCIL